MNCLACTQKFNTRKNVPMLLYKCGHSMCRECIEKRFQNGKVICVKCKQNNFAETIDDYPKNLTILEFFEPSNDPQNSMNSEENPIPIHSNLLPSTYECLNPKLKKDVSLNHPRNFTSSFKEMKQAENHKKYKNRPTQTFQLDQVAHDLGSKVCSFDNSNSNCEFASQSLNQEMCEIHQKKIEAFCFKDLQFLCLNCLIESSHQTHDICDIENAYSFGFSEVQRRINILTEHEKYNCETLNERAEQAIKNNEANAYYASKKVELFFSEIVSNINERKIEILNAIKYINKQ